MKSFIIAILTFEVFAIGLSLLEVCFTTAITVGIFLAICSYYFFNKYFFEITKKTEC